MYIYIQILSRETCWPKIPNKSDLAIANPHAINVVRYFQETY